MHFRVSRLGGAADGWHRLADRTSSEHGRAEGRVAAILAARPGHPPSCAVGQVGAERWLSRAAAGHHEVPAERSRLVEHGQAPAALQHDAVDQAPSQVRPAVTECQPGHGTLQQRIPERPLLAGAEVRQHDRRVGGIGPCGKAD
jgi:hypothetical protein